MPGAFRRMKLDCAGAVENESKQRRRPFAPSGTVCATVEKRPVGNGDRGAAFSMRFAVVERLP